MPASVHGPSEPRRQPGRAGPRFRIRSRRTRPTRCVTPAISAGAAGVPCGLGVRRRRRSPTHSAAAVDGARDATTSVRTRRCVCAALTCTSTQGLRRQRGATRITCAGPPAAQGRRAARALSPWPHRRRRSAPGSHRTRRVRPPPKSSGPAPPASPCCASPQGPCQPPASPASVPAVGRWPAPAARAASGFPS